MDYYICKTCGVQYQASDLPPAHCLICEDERQYIGPDGQQWITLAELQNNHHNIIQLQEPGLTGVGTSPSFAIGQRALLVQNPQGNVLWDCISLIDDSTIAIINSLGGIAAIAISHPHFYDSMLEWSQAFDAPIYLHSDDRQWVMRPDPRIHFWQAENQQLAAGLTLIRCGGHFSGSTVLHWAAGAGGGGVLLTGDTLQVVPDRRYVSFMYSYPNLIPLPAPKIRRILAALEPFSYERIYGGWWDRVIMQAGKRAVLQSARRYLAAIRDENQTDETANF
jgi:glyoxylase-like metal-dependent hydrolase (beta-lactamase superfamily II)